MKLKLKEWSNNYVSSVDDLKRVGNKIIAVSKSGDYGHIITYRHPTLTRRPIKGDLVEYADYRPFDRWVRKRAVVKATGEDWWCLTDHIGLKNTIVSLGMVIKIVKERLIPIKLFKYL